jgi:Protein of unknown function (DUF3326)
VRKRINVSVADIDDETVQKQIVSFQDYRLGVGVDRIAGAEAIISKLVVII